MTLEYRCSNCGSLLQTTNADPLLDEIDRLQAAKREALKAADGRSKENVALRALGKRAADTIRTLDPFGDHWSEHDLRQLAGEPTGALEEK